MLDRRIVKFIKRHHVLTLATHSGNGELYCANCFYAYDDERNVIVFSSDETTRHVSDLNTCSDVACSIVLETKVIGKVQGVQICGKAARGDAMAQACYTDRFPYAALMSLNIWTIEPTFVKFTDNTLGFGKKLIWKAD